MKRSVEVAIEVRYAETDQMGVVHHANYLIWYELARTRFCLETGTSYPEIEALGYFLIITQAQQNYRLAAHYGDTVKASCRLDWVTRRSLQFGYEVRRADQLLSTGYTRHLWVRRSDRRPCSMPQELVENYLALADQKTMREPVKSIPGA